MSRGQAPSAAAAAILPAAVLATLPEEVARYVTGCVNLTSRAGMAVSLGAAYCCADQATLRALLRPISSNVETPAAYIKALLDSWRSSPRTQPFWGAISLTNAADGGSVPQSSVQGPEKALSDATASQTAQALVRSAASEADIDVGAVALAAAAADVRHVWDGGPRIGQGGPHRSASHRFRDRQLAGRSERSSQVSRLHIDPQSFETGTVPGELVPLAGAEYRGVAVIVLQLYRSTT